MAETGDSKVLDTVIVGAGLAGLTGAYKLRHKKILPLEKEEDCGGRTLSRKTGEYVFNAGAQLVLNDARKTSKLHFETMLLLYGIQ